MKAQLSKEEIEKLKKEQIKRESDSKTVKK